MVRHSESKLEEKRWISTWANLDLWTFSTAFWNIVFKMSYSCSGQNSTWAIAKRKHLYAFTSHSASWTTVYIKQFSESIWWVAVDNYRKNHRKTNNLKGKKKQGNVQHEVKLGNSRNYWCTRPGSTGCFYFATQCLPLPGSRLILKTDLWSPWITWRGWVGVVVTDCFYGPR